MNKKTVIAEFCQNHNGDLSILKDMIWAAAESGADYAKIQTIHSSDLTYRDRFENGIEQNGETKAIKRPYQPEFDRLKTLDLSDDVYGWFIEECKKAGIHPLTTVFTKNKIDFMSSLGWESVKIASYDCASMPLLKMAKEKFKHIFISTGATFDNEIEMAAKLLKNVSFSLLHCVTIYPTPFSQMHLARLEYLRQFTDSVGFSDHSLVRENNIKASVVALHCGADVIERHFSILKETETKDGPVSINTDQLSELVSLANTNQTDRQRWITENVGDFSEMIGEKTRDLSQEELLNRDYYRGRFASKLSNGTYDYNWED